MPARPWLYIIIHDSLLNITVSHKCDGMCDIYSACKVPGHAWAKLWRSVRERPLYSPRLPSYLPSLSERSVGTQSLRLAASAKNTRRMSEELSEEESLLLPYMKNQLYQKCYSVIVNFPIASIAGLRLVDVGLLTISEHRELHSMPRTTAGISLLSTLEAKGDDSMASFYRVLVSAREEPDVKGILRHLEKEAQCRRPTPKDVSWQAGHGVVPYQISCYQFNSCTVLV